MVHEIIPDYNCFSSPYLFDPTLHLCSMPSTGVVRPNVPSVWPFESEVVWGFNAFLKTAGNSRGCFQTKTRETLPVAKRVVFGFGKHHFWVQVKVMKGINLLYNKNFDCFWVLSLGMYLKTLVKKTCQMAHVWDSWGSSTLWFSRVTIKVSMVTTWHIYYTFNSMQDLDDSEWQLTPSLQKVWNSQVVFLESIF